MCIACICNNGQNLICAVDGMLSDTGYSLISGDVMASKMLFLDQWVFMLSGTLSNGDLILEELRMAATTSKGKAKLSRENIRRMLPRAYGVQFSNWLAERWLAQYNMNMDDFKRRGKEFFGESRCAELSRLMEQDAEANFNESILACGWGAAPLSANIFGVDRGGFSSHTLGGFAAIGSGGGVAMSTLMQLYYGRHMPTEDALYVVASAKFASENCMGVGKSTTMCLLTKPKHSGESKWVTPLQSEHIERLRRLWERYGQPKIPKTNPALLELVRELEAWTTIGSIRQMQRELRRISRKAKPMDVPNEHEQLSGQSDDVVPGSDS